MNGCQMKLFDLKVREQYPTLGQYYTRSHAHCDKFLVQCSDSELMIVELYYGYKKRFIRDSHVRDIGCKRIVLYKVNLQDQVCQRMESLPEDCAIFLSYPENGFFYKIPREDLNSGLVRGNTVYFSEKNDKRLYAYDVKEGSVSVSLPCPNMGIDYYEPQWIQLPLHSWTSADVPQPEVTIDSKQIMLPSGSSSARGGWNDVPTDLLCDIQSCLFGADRCYFRLACKAWKSSFSNSNCESDLQLGKVQRNHRFPILMHIGNNSELVKFFDPITNSTSTLPLPSLKATEPIIRCSKHGWLLISQGISGHRQLFFLNPFTNERIDLPNVRFLQDGISFSSPPTSSDCMVICYAVFPAYVTLYSIRRGNYSWAYSSAEKKGIHFKSSYSNPVYHQGLFYIMGINGNLCIHDPGPRHSTKFMSLPRRPCASIRRGHLLESRGKLLSVSTGPVTTLLSIVRP
ncbi:unnamed protein product [Linum trigynum]|uniref:KIB1-4 beta-propeller domain-containing protein n=1 Tax=Linum trigynum TaxID=586398 RepID=A0AAV2F5M4_9ROSI